MIIFTVLLAVPTQNPAPSTQLTDPNSHFFIFNVEMHKFAGTRGKPSACALDYRPTGLMALPHALPRSLVGRIGEFSMMSIGY